MGWVLGVWTFRDTACSGLLVFKTVFFTSSFSRLKTTFARYFSRTCQPTDHKILSLTENKKYPYAEAETLQQLKNFL